MMKPRFLPGRKYAIGCVAISVVVLGGCGGPPRKTTATGDRLRSSCRETSDGNRNEPPSRPTTDDSLRRDGPAAAPGAATAAREQRVFALKEITPQRGQALLSELGLGTASIVPDRRAVAVSGSANDLQRAGVLLDLVDTKEEFLIETLAPLSNARTIPTNVQIAAALGGIAIGTFTQPPQHSEHTRAIIDIHGQSVVAIIPARLQRQLLAFVTLGVAGPPPAADKPKPVKPVGRALNPRVDSVDGPDARGVRPHPTPTSQSTAEPTLVWTWLVNQWKHACASAGMAPELTSEAVTAQSPVAQSRAPTASEKTGGQLLTLDKSVRCQELTPAPPVPSTVRPDKERQEVEGGSTAAAAGKPAETKSPYEVAPPANGDDVLQLALSDHMELGQLLDLAAEYLHLDYLYDPEKIRGQSVSLRLHGKLQGEVRVKDLYPLLESVLKFKGFAMTCHKGNLVTIMPMADALQTDPTLVDPNGAGLEAGEMVVTRVFKLQHVSAGSAVKLLEGMKLGAAAFSVQETDTLVVTCYAHRMARIERLLDLVDQPGRPKEFRFRQLQHTVAGPLSKKVELLVAELQSPALRIGPVEQAIMAIHPPAGLSPGMRKSVETALPDSLERRTVYLEADEGTNRILMVGYPEQLATVEKIVAALDVEQQELRTFKVYEIKYVDAEDVKKQLTAFKLIEEEEPKVRSSVSRKAQSAPGTPASAESPAVGNEERVLNLPERSRESQTAAPQAAQASVLTASNSLLVNATPVQHARIACVIGYVDTTARAEAIPYEIYALENQDPEHLAEVLQKLLKETIVNKEGKIEKEIRRTEEDIVIVPDKNTFSLIVYANKRNQDWIRKLVTTLDKRRPQVLIDATLVEVTKTDAFTYDLNLLGSLPNIASTAAVSGADPKALVKLLQSQGGTFTAFYGDDHIQALLQAMQSKNYGRVLAKPKILVNDNEPGKIKTTDVTYVETTSSIPVTSGAAGSQTNLVQTAVKYDPYEAGITLDITPHISEGDLLRLDIALTRSDFVETSDSKKPPNKRSNEVNTKVTVPDGSTIILGGLLKLNQNKGGTKVPILGDIPLLGGLFRTINNKDTQNKLYVFVKAEVIRPSDRAGRGLDELSRTSQRNREAFEKHELEFQNHEAWPGVPSKPIEPPKVLDAY